MSLPESVQLEKNFLKELVNSDDFKSTFMLGDYKCTKEFKRTVCRSKSTFLTNLMICYPDIYKSMTGQLKYDEIDSVYVCMEPYSNYCFVTSNWDYFDFKDDIFYCPRIDIRGIDLYREHQYIHHILKYVVNLNSILVDITTSCYSNKFPDVESYHSRSFRYELTNCVWFRQMLVRDYHGTHEYLDFKIYNPRGPPIRLTERELRMIKFNLKSEFISSFESIWMGATWSVQGQTLNLLDPKERVKYVNELFNLMYQSNLKSFNLFKL